MFRDVLLMLAFRGWAQPTIESHASGEKAAFTMDLVEKPTEGGGGSQLEVA